MSCWICFSSWIAAHFMMSWPSSLSSTAFSYLNGLVSVSELQYFPLKTTISFGMRRAVQPGSQVALPFLSFWQSFLRCWDRIKRKRRQLSFMTRQCCSLALRYSWMAVLAHCPWTLHGWLLSHALLMRKCPQGSFVVIGDVLKDLALASCRLPGGGVRLHFSDVPFSTCCVSRTGIIALNLFHSLWPILRMWARVGVFSESC